MKREQSKKIFFIYAAGVLVLISTLIGITFAYFSTTIIGNDSASSINTTTANLGNITFIDGDAINIDNIYPGWSDTKTFTVANTESGATEEISYAVFLYVETNTITPVAAGAFKYSLTGTSTNSGTTISLSDQIVPYGATGPATILLSADGVLNGEDTHTYTFTIEFEETDADQNAAQGKSFSGVLQVNVADGYGLRTWDSTLNKWKTYYEITAESCFDFDDGTIIGYYDNQGDNGLNPECPRDVVIPTTIEEELVTTIGDYAFWLTNLTSVIIPDSVTTIGEAAFASNDLTSVIIPSTVTIIDAYAFVGNFLTSITIPSSVMNLENYAFNANMLTSVCIKNKTSSADFTSYGVLIWAWSGWNDSYITWNCPN